jgi:hypothetical protein
MGKEGEEGWGWKWRRSEGMGVWETRTRRRRRRGGGRMEWGERKEKEAREWKQRRKEGKETLSFFVIFFFFGLAGSVLPGEVW